MPPLPTERSDGSVLSAVVSLVLGAVLGVAVPKLFEGGASLLDSSLSTIAIIIAGVLAFVTFAHGRADGKRLEALTTELAMIRSRIGEPAELTIESFAKSTGEYHRRLERLIDRLGPGDEVFVLAYHSRSVTEEQTRTPAHVEARRAYLNTLLRKAQEGVIYHRILCFEPVDGKVRVRPEFIREHTRNHCIGMIDLAAVHGASSIAVKMAPAHVTADILIINHEIGAISLETYEAERTYTTGALIVHDPPNGRIVEQLRDWWVVAYAKSEPVTKSELELPG